MSELIKKNSKFFGALLGLLQGLPQGLGMEHNQLLFKVFQDQMVTVVAFGLLAPPVIALLNSVSKVAFGANLMRKVNEYVNIYFMMIVGCFALGISGLFTLQSKGINGGAIVICAFFISGGVGFLIAYFVDGQFGRRSEKNA